MTSAGALVDALHAMGMKRISVVCPYMKPLTRLVVDYIESEGIEVKDYVALEIPDNLQVAAQDPAELMHIYKRLDRANIDGIGAVRVRADAVAAFDREGAGGIGGAHALGRRRHHVADAQEA